jgi:butyryl-CoA dehydrogenase
MASLLTPIVKAFQTDLGFEVANLGLQVHGGYGYVKEYGVEQLVRDARITHIYQGTTRILALDLVGRTLPAHMGRNLRRFFHPVASFLQEEARNPAMAEFVEPTAKAFERLQRATAWLAQEAMKNPDEAGAAATEYLHLFGYTAFAYLWARMARVAQERLENAGGQAASGSGSPPGGLSRDDRAFYEAKLATARFFMQRLLPRSGGLFATIMAGSKPIMAFPDAAF